MRWLMAVPAALVVCALTSALTAQESPLIAKRFVYYNVNHADAKQVDKAIEIFTEAKKAGYTGVMVTDSKFDKWKLYGDDYANSVKRLRQAVKDLGLEYVCHCCPMGYAETLLANDPNLAEGMPVIDQLFVVKDGKLVPDPSDVPQFVNGSFDEFNGDAPTGWEVDTPGKCSFIDTEVKHDGKASVRMQDIGTTEPNKRARIMQDLKNVKPWHYYHLSAWVKTEGATNKDYRLGPLCGNVWLDWQPPAIDETMDWKRIDITFNTVEFNKARLYLGTWDGKAGKIWWDDVKIEPGGFVNVLRRDDLPLTVKSEDGKTTYVEGKDFSRVEDPKLLHDPNPGYFTRWHDAPVVTVPAGSALAEGRKVLVSYHHAIDCGKVAQVNCCFSEPKLYDILASHIAWIHKTAQPDGYFMSHDEIRHGAYDAACQARNLTAGQILADNLKKCTEIIKKEDPGKEIYVWNDCFDANHNAKKERYQLVRGDTGWWGSWEGLDKEVIVGNWMNNKEPSLKFFSDLGNRQILAGYYDADPSRIIGWLSMAAKVKGVIGVMYTTWRRDYKQLDKWMEFVKGFPGNAK